MYKYLGRRIRIWSRHMGCPDGEVARIVNVGTMTVSVPRYGHCDCNVEWCNCTVRFGDGRKYVWGFESPLALDEAMSEGHKYSGDRGGPWSKTAADWNGVYESGKWKMERTGE